MEKGSFGFCSLSGQELLYVMRLKRLKRCANQKGIKLFLVSVISKGLFRTEVVEMTFNDMI